MPKYKHLLSPIVIGGTVIKNRMLSAFNLPKYMQGPETYPSENYISFYANIARNGAGIVDLATWDRYPQQRNGHYTTPSTHMPAFDTTNPATLNYISELVEEIHLYGAKATMGIGPAEILRRPGDEGTMAATWPDESWTEAQIEEAIEKYVDKVQMYVNCGLDGVVDRIDHFLVPMFSDGTVERGKSVKERVDYSIRCFRRLKERFGAGFLIEGILAGEEPYGYTGKSDVGYRLDDFLEYAKLAEDCIDILQIRNNCMINVHPTGFTFQKGQHENLAYCKALKQAGINILAMPIGGFQDPEEMDRLIAEGTCDLVGMSRAFFADYDFYKKIEEGRGEDIRPCIWCNSCHGPTYDGKAGPWVNRCTVNPELGFEARKDRLVKSPTKRQKVAVIGGGTAGLQAAITAAERGHQVTLYEKTGYLGGQLFHAESFSFKWPLRDFKNWQVRQAKKLGVEILLNTEATPERIEAGHYDAVLAATGAEPSFPSNIPGLRNADGTVNPAYRHVHAVFGKEAELGKHVVILGGSETGVETALYLLENGHDVTILTRQPKIAHDASKSHYITLTWMDPRRGDGRADESPEWTKYDNLTSIVNASDYRLEGNTVFYTDATGRQQSVTGDTILINGGVKPRQEDALRFYGSADRFYVIGDANGVGNVQKAVREGWSRAATL